MKLNRFILVLLIVLIVNDFTILAKNIAIAYVIAKAIDSILGKGE